MHPPIRLALAATLTLIALASGCLAPERGDVQKDWNVTLRELGINPIFPPREDVQVGDVYLRRGNPATAILLEKQGFVPIDLWVTSIDLHKALGSSYGGDRPSFPITPKERGAPAGSATPPSDTFAVFDNSRLRLVAFPEFKALTVKGVDLQALVPVQAATVAAGADWQGSHQVEVKIRSAESCGLPAKLVLASLWEPTANGKAVRLKADVLATAMLQALHAGQKDASQRTAGLQCEVRFDRIRPSVQHPTASRARRTSRSRHTAAT